MYRHHTLIADLCTDPRFLGPREIEEEFHPLFVKLSLSLQSGNAVSLNLEHE